MIVFASISVVCEHCDRYLESLTNLHRWSHHWSYVWSKDCIHFDRVDDCLRKQLIFIYHWPHFSVLPSKSKRSKINSSTFLEQSFSLRKSDFVLIHGLTDTLHSSMVDGLSYFLSRLWWVDDHWPFLIEVVEDLQMSGEELHNCLVPNSSNECKISNREKSKNMHCIFLRLFHSIVHTFFDRVVLIRISRRFESGRISKRRSRTSSCSKDLSIKRRSEFFIRVAWCPQLPLW